MMSAKSQDLVIFSHGKESGPWGTKIAALAEIARAKGLRTESPDYTRYQNPDERVKVLESLLPSLGTYRKLVLVGSSMGAYVATVMSRELSPSGLFLMAPAFYREGYACSDPAPFAERTMIVHGWADELIPPEDIFRYAKHYAVSALFVNSDHRLTSALPMIKRLFAQFLDEILSEEV